MKRRCSELLRTINSSASCQIWQVKLKQPNLRRFPEETAGTLCGEIHTAHLNTKYSCFDDRVKCFFSCISLLFNAGNIKEPFHAKKKDGVVIIAVRAADDSLALLPYPQLLLRLFPHKHIVSMIMKLAQI